MVHSSRMANNLHCKGNGKRYVVKEEIHPRMPVTEEGRSHAITAAAIIGCDARQPDLALPTLYLSPSSRRHPTKPSNTGITPLDRARQALEL